ncbi:MAG: phosphoribosylglycinamide formyltransferase [Terriglobia bacterium]
MNKRALRLGWFSTGRDQAARALLSVVSAAIKEGRLHASLEFVFSSRDEGEGSESDQFLRLAHEEGLPVVTLSSAKFLPKERLDGAGRISEEWRRKYDSAVVRALGPFKVDLVVLAGYMLIVSSRLCDAFAMINLHPALPGGPVGAWQDVIDEVIDDGHEETGAMIHLVTEELDRGPALTFFSFSTVHGVFEPLRLPGKRPLLFERIRAEGAERELPLVYLTLERIADGTLKIAGSRSSWRGREIEGGVSLNDEIDLFLEQAAAAPPGC